MKSSYAALGVVGLAVAGLWYAGGGTAIQSQSVAAAEQMRVSAPVTHENLTVFFIHGPDAVAATKVVTLQEAMEAGWAVIHETGNVNNLTVENQSSEYELFIQEGDIIRGGRQDRMIACDMLLPPKSGQVSFPCNCVERGRWSGRGDEAATHFNKSDQFAVGHNQKCANINLQQDAVWNSVAEKQKELAKATQTKVTSDVSVTSFQLTLENPVIKAKIVDYEAALKAAGESQTDVLGVVFLVNGEMTGAEIYGSNALFQKAWPKLLRSAATEALAEMTDKPLRAAPSARELERFLAHAGQFDSPATTNRPGASSLINIDREIAGFSNLGGIQAQLPDVDMSSSRLPSVSTTYLELMDKIENVNVQFEGNVNDITLNELLTYLSKKYAVRFVVMEEYFKADGGMEIKEKKPTVSSTKLNGLELGTFLDLVLASLGATYIVRPDYVEITTFDRRLEERVTRVTRVNAMYQTQGLTSGGGAGGSRGSTLGSTTLSTLGSTPVITAHTTASGNIAITTNSASNFLANIYGNPTYGGVLTNSQTINNGPGGFGTPLANNAGSTAPTEGRPASDGRVRRVRIEGTEATTDRAVLNQLDRQVIAGGTSQAVPQTNNPVGNQLNINRIENAAGLVTESRDPTRQNAVIHKSYIKLGSKATGVGMPNGW